MIFKLTMADIYNSNGTAIATLRSGVQLTGKVSRSLSNDEVLHLKTERGFHVIPYEEIAALTGESGR